MSCALVPLSEDAGVTSSRADRHGKFGKSRKPFREITPMGKKAVKPFNKLVIKEIPAHGDLSDDLKGKTIGALIGDCGDLLDHQNIVTSEVFGRVLFKAENGKWYTVNVEAIVVPLSEKDVKEKLQLIEDDGEIGCRLGRQAEREAIKESEDRLNTVE